MSMTSPDGAWRWDGRQWVPNEPWPGSPATHATATINPPGSSLAAYPADWEREAAGWSHFGPLIACAAAMVLMLSVIGSVIALLAVFSFVIPLIIRGNQGARSAFVRAHATESLNFQLTWLIFSAVAVLFSVMTLGIGLVLVLPLSFAASIFMIVVMAKAGSAAKRGELYRYPVAIRFV